VGVITSAAKIVQRTAAGEINNPQSAMGSETLGTSFVRAILLLIHFVPSYILQEKYKIL
jgi:hypothetical protein